MRMEGGLLPTVSEVGGVAHLTLLRNFHRMFLSSDVVTMLCKTGCASDNILSTPHSLC